MGNPLAPRLTPDTTSPVANMTNEQRAVWVCLTSEQRAAWSYIYNIMINNILTPEEIALRPRRINGPHETPVPEQDDPLSSWQPMRAPPYARRPVLLQHTPVASHAVPESHNRQYSRYITVEESRSRLQGLPPHIPPQYSEEVNDCWKRIFEVWRCS
ncbi:hypothetical protein CIB48_g4811 [Xylaria polymorpha]|nr:hypothetical protein CIB48_g4811 [Xylaria polymorpha]